LNNLKGIEQIHILGATGGRTDHTIGNVSLLMEYTRMFDLGDITIEMVTDDGTIFPINDTIEFECGPGRSMSIFTPDSTLKIKSEGLMYPTDNVVFDNWWKATLNKTVQDTIRLELSHRSVALIMLD
jgi:thiamine pyrophosphokinase